MTHPHPRWHEPEISGPEDVQKILEQILRSAEHSVSADMARHGVPWPEEGTPPRDGLRSVMSATIKATLVQLSERGINIVRLVQTGGRN